MATSSESMMMTATTKMEMQPKKKSFFGRLRGRTREKEDTRDQTPSPSEQPAADATSMTSPAAAAAAASTPKLFADSNVLNRDNHDTTMKAAPRLPEADARKPHKQLPIRKRHELLKPPTAREAAYGGPPRYDWIDIETAAAIRVQSIFRRNQTMKYLEGQGMTTAAIRNRSRKRQARMGSRGTSGSTDVPTLFACCGVGLAFGDSTEESYQQSRQHEMDQYMDRKKEREDREEELRVNFKKLEAKKKAARRTDVAETIEVVDE